MQQARQFHWLKTLALLGMILSAFLTYHYYAPEQTSPCILGDYFTCAMDTTPYARIDGIFHFLTVDLGVGTNLPSFPLPNDVLFFLAFFLLFFATSHLEDNQLFLGASPKQSRTTFKIIFYILAAYSIYLTYVQTYLLYTFCLLCFLTTLLIFASLWFLIALHFLPSQKTSVSRRASLKKHSLKKSHPNKKRR